jgi:hypothetical protein
MWGGLAEEIKSAESVDNPSDVKLNMKLSGEATKGRDGLRAKTGEYNDYDDTDDYDDSDSMDLKSSTNKGGLTNKHARKPSMPKFNPNNNPSVTITNPNQGVSVATSNPMALKSNAKKTATSPLTNHKRTSSYSVMMMRNQSNNTNNSNNYVNQSDMETNATSQTSPLLLQQANSIGLSTSSLLSQQQLLQQATPRYNQLGGSNGSINSLNSKVPAASYSLKSGYQQQQSMNTNNSTSYHSQLSLNLNSMNGSSVQLLQQHSPDTLINMMSTTDGELNSIGNNSNTNSNTTNKKQVF